MGVSTRICSAGNGGTHYVANAKNRGSFGFSQFDSRQCIGGFARLRDGNYDVTLLNNRIAVAKLRRVFDLDRNAG